MSLFMSPVMDMFSLEAVVGMLDSVEKDEVVDEYSVVVVVVVIVVGFCSDSVVVVIAVFQ